MGDLKFVYERIRRSQDGEVFFFWGGYEIILIQYIYPTPLVCPSQQPAHLARPGPLKLAHKNAYGKKENTTFSSPSRSLCQPHPQDAENIGGTDLVTVSNGGDGPGGSPIPASLDRRRILIGTGARDQHAGGCRTRDSSSSGGSKQFAADHGEAAGRRGQGHRRGMFVEGWRGDGRSEAAAAGAVGGCRLFATVFINSPVEKILAGGTDARRDTFEVLDRREDGALLGFGEHGEGGG